MSNVDIAQPTDDLAEKLPKYCDFFKHLLVEELALDSDYKRIHYGKCAIIGRLCAVPDYFKLENVTVPHLPSDYKLPTGAVSLLLLNFTSDTAGDQGVTHGSYCIVRGEVVLCNIQKPNSPVLTIRGLHESLHLLGDNEEASAKFLEQIQTTHKPALSVWYIRRIEQAEELIQSRLEIRVLCNEINNPLFFIFSQLFYHTESKNPFEPQCKNQIQQDAWLEFWEREGHVQLERKWHKHYPEYKQEIEEATSTRREAWEALWEEHASNQSAHFWHVYTCAFQNYENDLTNGLQDDQQVLDDVNEHFTDLNIKQGIDCTDSSESNEEEEYLSANDDPEVLEEEQQLRLLGLPTTFGTQIIQKKSKAKPQPQLQLEIESDSDTNLEVMTKDANNDLAMHSVQSRVIKKKKPKGKKKIPECMKNNNAMLKYWFKRFSLFSLFDRGIQLDDESWFSVTPEKIAKQTATRLACDIVVDAFCGCGGNAIQFAKTCGRVIAIDIDANKLAMAKHNAAIYGVADKIEFIHADFIQFARSTSLRPDVVFLSPPWGGPNYQKGVFDIELHLLPVGATQLMQYARRLTDNIGIFLPRSSNIKQVIALSNVGQQCEVEHNYLDTRLVAITAYYGNIIKNQQQNEQSDETHVS